MRFHEILFQTDTENFSFLSYKTKNFIPKKKYDLGRSQYQNKKALFTDPILTYDPSVPIHSKRLCLCLLSVMNNALIA